MEKEHVEPTIRQLEHSLMGISTHMATHTKPIFTVASGLTLAQIEDDVKLCAAIRMRCHKIVFGDEN